MTQTDRIVVMAAVGAVVVGFAVVIVWAMIAAANS
jgi:hypothetical protein